MCSHYEYGLHEDLDHWDSQESTSSVQSMTKVNAWNEIWETRFLYEVSYTVSTELPVHTVRLQVAKWRGFTKCRGSLGNVKVKVKFTRYRPGVGVEVQLYSSMTAALERGEWSAARPGYTLPPGKTRYPFYRRLSGPQGRSGRAENLVPTGIRSRIVQPVVSRYTDWATGPTDWVMYI